MLIDSKRLPEIIEVINKEPFISIDTETTGLKPYDEDFLFAITISTKTDDYYFNFNHNQPDSEGLLPYAIIKDLVKPDYSGTIFMHNANFDLKFLSREGLRLDSHDVHCTMAIARIIFNNEFRYTLDALTKKYLGNSGKDDRVKEYIKRNKCYTIAPRPGRKRPDKHPHYDQVPLDIMQPYAELDTRLTYDLGMYQYNFIQKNFPSKDLYTNEKKLTGVFFRMDNEGIFTDYNFTSEAARHEESKVSEIQHEWRERTGILFKDHWSCLAAAYRKFGFDYGKTAKGNPSFKDDIIKHQKHDLAHMIREHRKHYNRWGTYESINYFSNDLSVVHPYSKQAGCTTGRVSYSDPPVQCMEKSKTSDEKYLIRRSFCPRPGHSLFMLDYDQMEYRMLLNLAGQMDLIEEVKGGKDVHTATAEANGIDRDTAKCVHEDTLLMTGNGFKRIGDLVKHKRVDSFKKVYGEVVMGPSGMIPVKNHYNNGFGETLLVISRYGILSCSKKHRFKLKDGSLKKANDLVKGDILADSVPIEIEGSYQKIKLNMFYNCLDKNGLFDVTITEDLAYFLGVFIGDGTANKNTSSICCGMGDREKPYLKVIMDAAKKIGLRPSCNESNGVYNIYLGSKYLVDFWRSVGVVDDDRKKLCVPTYILNSPFSVRLNFLAGLVDTDGTVCKKQGAVSITTKSWVLCQDLSVLLNSLGICASIEPSFNKKYGKYYYRIRLAKKHTYLLYPYLLNKYKKDRLKKPSFIYKKYYLRDNEVLLVDNIGPCVLKDLEVCTKDHLYITNNLITHNTLNFFMVYGGGPVALAEMLDISELEARELRANYFRVMPDVKRFLDDCNWEAETNGYVTNWFGRRTYIYQEEAYKAPNYLIQGGCADWIKQAMVNIDNFLATLRQEAGTNINLLLQVHDELVFEIPEGSEEHVKHIQYAMENVTNNAPHDKLKYTVGVDWSKQSWQDKKPWNEK